MVARFFRFKDPRFWLIVALNLLNAGLVWAMQTKPFTPGAQLGIGVIALINALMGMWLTVLLVREPLKGSRADPPDHADRGHDIQKDDRG